MAPKSSDIGWQHGSLFGGEKRKIMCKYCSKVVTDGITRFKQHLARVSGNVEMCLSASDEIANLMRNHLKEGISKRELEKKKKIRLIESLQSEKQFNQYGQGQSDDDDDDDDHHTNMSRLEKEQLKQILKQSRQEFQMEEERRRNSVSGVGPSMLGVKPGLKRNFSVKEGVELPTEGLDSFMLKSKKSTQRTLKNIWSKDALKKVGKAVSKFFIFNAIPFNAADSGPYYQSMIDTIAEVGPGVKGPTGYQIGNTYLDEEVEEVGQYIESLHSKWKKYGCTLMCDGWSSRTKKPIINFMVYCDRQMVFHSSVDTTGQTKTAEYIFRLMDGAVEEVGEEQVVHVVTDNEPNFKAAGQMLMQKRQHLFWSPCAAHCIDLMLEDIGKMSHIKKTIEEGRMITSFIYKSLKLVNLMREYTQNRELLRPGITRFATEYIAIESLIRYQADLKRMCADDQWREFNRERSRRNTADKVSDLILTTRFWKKAAELQAVMEPLVKVLKLVTKIRSLHFALFMKRWIGLSWL